MYDKKEYAHWYWETHKEELKTKKKANYKKYYPKVAEKRKKQASDYYYKNRERIKLLQKKYRGEHKDKNKEYLSKWRETNRDHKRILNKEWQQANPEKAKESLKKFKELHPERYDEFRAEWVKNNPEKVKESRKKCKANRRDLGFVPLNDYFDGCHGHHINRDYIIYIPSKLHQLYQGHTLKKPSTMVKINRVAFDYLINGGFF